MNSMKLLVPIALVAVLCSLLPGSVVAAGPDLVGRDATHPQVMEQAATEVATAKVGPLTPFVAAPKRAAVGGSGGLQREIFGFALLSSLSDPTIGYPSWNFSLLSTVAVFGLHVNDNGTFANDSGMSVWNSGQLSGLISTAHAAGTRVVLTIIMQDFCVNDPARGCASGNPTPHMCAALARRATTVAQTVAQVTAKGVDGVNIDYEGLQVSCANGQNPRAAVTDLAKQLRAAPALAGSYLSVDTYASSAGDPVGFFDVPGLNAYADSFFVMAYDSDRSNYSSAPLNCTRYCLNPVSPLTGYLYNDTRASAEYRSAVPASKVILGLPYYSRADCVATWAPNQYPDGRGNFNLPYTQAVTMATDPTNSSYALNRDAHDVAGQSPWSTWTSNSNPVCPMEMYWDDVASLGQKYDLVNQDGLRGVGIWNLNFGGGKAELWNELNVKFGTSTPWYTLGGALTSGPDAASWNANRSDVFVRGTDNAIYHRWWDGVAWRGWESLGGVATSDPSAVSWADGRIDLFVRGTDNALYHRVWNGVWNGWESLGGGLTSGADVASWGANRLDVFVRGNDNGLWHRVWFGSGWSNWESLGGVLTSDPSAVSWGLNRVDVLMRGADNSLQHKAWDGTHWLGWESLGGTLTTSPDATSCSAGHFDVFVLGVDSAVYQLGFGGDANIWQRLGGKWSADPGAVCRPGTHSIDLFERDQDAAAWRTSTPGT